MGYLARVPQFLRRFYWPLVLVSLAAGVVAIPYGIGILITYGLSGMCDDNGYCGAHLPSSYAVDREALLSLAWLAAVLLVVCLLPGKTPRVARAAGVFTTFALFSAMVWLPVTQAPESGLLGSLIFAAPVFASIAGAWVAQRPKRRDRSRACARPTRDARSRP